MNSQSNKCIHKLFEEQVERTPNAIAVTSVGKQHQLTYRELNCRANQLAHYLQKLGVKSEELIGISLNRSPEIVVAILAILKVGAAYVPLDPNSPKERLAFILQDSQTRIILTQQHLIGELPESDELELVCLDRDWNLINQESLENFSGELKVENSAYAIYTSGSTGTPKGVLVSHHNVVRLFLSTQSWYQFNENDVWPLFHSYAFDVSVWEIWGALLHGGRLVVVPYLISRSPEAFYDLICEEKVTVLNQTPSAFRQLIWAEEFGNISSHNKHCLRLVIFAGEALEFQSLKPWFEKHGDKQPQLVNMYGITETTVHVTYRPLTIEDLDSAKGSMIGIPIPDLQIYILDQERNPVPTGVTGEIYVGGAGVSKGYINRPELNAERFIPNFFSNEPGDFLYKSGDLARYLPSGELEYLGRIDHQVKISGFRIELGEIESVLAKHPAVQESVTIVQSEKNGDKYLAAYVVPNEKSASTVRQLLRLENADLLSDRSRNLLPNGMEILHLNKNETDFVYEEIFEDAKYLKHGISLNDGDCVFDIGANIGLFSLFVNRICKNAEIFAFESTSPTFEILKLNTILYGLNAKVFDHGISSTAKRKKLDELVAELLTSEVLSRKVKTISDIIRDHSVKKINLLKIDAGKNELDVLQGIEEEDWSKIEQIIVKVDDINGKLKLVTAMLEDRGFDLAIEEEFLLKNTGIHNIYAIHQSSHKKTISEFFPGKSNVSKQEWNSPNILVEDLRSFLKQKLPDYMIPSKLLLLDSLPLTLNGKIDRRLLQSSDNILSPDLKSNFVAPSTVIEQQIADIWIQVLDLKQVSIHDNFIELGGYSLIATQIISRLRKTFEIDLPFHILFEAPTIAELSNIVGEKVRYATQR